MKRLAIIALLFSPLAAVGQNAKSEPLFNQAVEKSVVGQYEEAVKLLNRAIDADPKYAEAWLLLGRQHLLLFTGGIGENAWFMRRPILEGLECLGIDIDFSKNDNVMGEDIILSTPKSKMAVVVCTTDEEYVIASDTYKLVTK